MKIDAVRRFALALPDVTEEPHHQFSSFRIKGRIFVTVPPDETHIHLFVDEDSREAALAMYPEFLEKLLWGGKVAGLRARLAGAKPDAIQSLVKQAWQHKAPKASSSRAARRPAA